MSNRLPFILIYFLLALFISGLITPHSLAYNDKLCRATVDCPPDYDGDTVTVGYNVAILSEFFEHCAPDSIKEGIVDTVTDTISLFIIIDQSASMSIMDPESKRYSIAGEIIDTIHKHSPASEIGMAVFSNKLMHNFETDSFFNQLDNSQVNGWNDSYIPLTRLDSQVGSVSAVEKLKWAIELSDTAIDPGNNKKLVNAYYESSGRQQAYNGGTDISIAFEAAVEAFKSATYEKKRQFIVFISDGIHQLIDTERQQYARDYLAGDSVPTTYTAFFVNQGQPIPDQIDTMTLNIQNNGYSDNNYSSTVWSTQSQEQKFFSLLLNNVIGDGLKHFFSSPVSMIINGDSATIFDDTFAYYETPLVPLNAHSPTTMNVTYTWHWEAPINKDVTKEYTVVIRHSNVGTPDLESVDCWNRGKIKFYYYGNEIIAAGATHTLVEVRFFPPDSGNYPPIAGTVDLILTNNNASDMLTVTLNKDITGTYYSTTFPRQYAPPNLTDGILQNSNNDSIRAIYRNPIIPIDTLRYAINVLPFLDLSVKKVYYLDKNANGYPDSVRIEQGGGRVLSVEDCAVLKPYISFSTPRQIAAQSVIPLIHGFDVGINEEPGTVPNTGLYNDERINIICNNITLPSGTVFPYTDTTIADSMAPVIVRADYYDLANPVKIDTLRVIFSEDVRTITNTEPFKFNRSPTIPEYKLRLAYIRTDSNVVVFAVINLTGQTYPQKGDSIWINEAANVSDPVNNRQYNPGNIRRLLNYYLVISIESATYLDTSSVKDGLIDVITVKTDAVPDQALRTALLNTITLPDYRDLTVTGNSATDSGFAILVSQPQTGTPVTNIDPEKDSMWVTLTSSTTNCIIFGTQTIINDGVATVINVAVFGPKFVTQGTAVEYDTLEITFSEPVKSPPYIINKPFLFKYVSGVQIYTMVLQPLMSDSSGQAQTFLVLSSEKPYPEIGDPVWIDTAAFIYDLAGNVQNKNNRPVPLIVKPRNFDIIVTVAPNPGDFDQIITIDNIQKQGILVKVDIIGGWSPYVTMEALLYVFDAVGNTISKVTGIPSSDKKSFYFIWDGVNQYDRIVAEGTYLGHVTIKSSDGIKKNDRVFIGVKGEEANPFR